MADLVDNPVLAAIMNVKGVPAYKVGPVDETRKKKVEKWLHSVKDRLLNWQPNLCQALFTRAEMKELIVRAREVFWSEPVLMEVKAPVKIFGDIHGQYTDLLTLLKINGYPPATKYVFLGDYVDRGDFSVEVTMLVFVFKLLYPKEMTVLRGNHESKPVNSTYSFINEVHRRFERGKQDRELYNLFNSAFNCMPCAARINYSILCMHGGISEDIIELEHLNHTFRPCDIPDFGPIADITWSDPSTAIENYDESPRGAAHLFGHVALDEFLKRHNLKLIVRAHQMVPNGYEFFHDRKLVTLFSAPQYGGADNKAAVMCISKDREITFNVYNKNLEDGTTSMKPMVDQKEPQ